MLQLPPGVLPVISSTTHGWIDGFALWYILCNIAYTGHIYIYHPCSCPNLCCAPHNCIFHTRSVILVSNSLSLIKCLNPCSFLHPSQVTVHQPNSSDCPTLKGVPVSHVTVPGCPGFPSLSSLAGQLPQAGGRAG